MLLKPPSASSVPLICFVPVGLYHSATSTPPSPTTTTAAQQLQTTTTTRITTLYDVGSEDVDDDQEARKLEDGEVSCCWSEDGE